MLVKTSELKGKALSYAFCKSYDNTRWEKVDGDVACRPIPPEEMDGMMRGRVSGILGDTVDIPDELVTA